MDGNLYVLGVDGVLFCSGELMGTLWLEMILLITATGSKVHVKLLMVI